MKFDLALTVGVMRYISDLHIGKVNPKHLDFAFDQESKKYDLAEFLKRSCCRSGRCRRRSGTSGAAIPRLPPCGAGSSNVHGRGEEG